MFLLDLSIQSRVIIGITAMVVLFVSFLIVFISNQRKKLKYHRDLQAMQEENQQLLKEQNALLERRVQERTAELSEQKEVLQTTLRDLRSSQSQLIQKEKMASLGELTAGIAHEIQNPLNFVINFGEINAELLAEIKGRVSSEALSDEFNRDVVPLIDDCIENLDKVLQHGRKADGIVKNMLQHSRKDAGIMELTDVNELSEEYLKMAYHGFRGKHKSFHCTFRMSFDRNLPQVNIIPPDIGQILVNLYINAFYSMNEKSKLNLSGYEPTLGITTLRNGQNIAIQVRDNGMGMSPKVIDKIFQPFFTTKPTGEATGLGLSLSYDMIKAHQGDLRAESKEGEWAEFTIELNA